MLGNRIITPLAFMFNIVIKEEIGSKAWLVFGVFIGLKEDETDTTKDLKLIEARRDPK